LAYKDPKWKKRAKKVNILGDTEAPPTPPQPEPQTDAPVNIPTSPVERPSETKPQSGESLPPPSAEVTEVRGLAKLKSMSKDAKDTIICELKRGIENPYYKLMSNGALAYKNAQMRKHKKIANAFGEPKEYIDFGDPDEIESTDPIADTGAVASANEVAVVEQKVKPPPFKKMVPDLRKEARVDSTPNTPPSLRSESLHDTPGPLTGTRRRLTISDLTGTVNIGNGRIDLKIGGPFY
jgi:hypothetical protein